MKSLIALYNDFATAKQVVQDLEAKGIKADKISILVQNSDGELIEAEEPQSVGFIEGMGIGTVEGGAIGLLAGLSALAIPGFGPILAVGPILGVFAGAGIGAVTGGVVGGLLKLGLSEDEANYYAEGIQRGEAFVTVEIEDENAVYAREIMDFYKQTEPKPEAPQGETGGWRKETVDHGMTNGLDSADTTNGQRLTEQTVSLPVVQEELNVGKRLVDHGGIRLHSRITEKAVSKEVSLREEHLTVSRLPTNRPIDNELLGKLEERTIKIRALAEEAVVSKVAQVVEEVVIQKSVTQRTETIEDTLRRRDVEIETFDGTIDSPSFAELDEEFRQHYDDHHPDASTTYEQARPAYQYAYALANDPINREREWHDIEEKAQRDWEEKNQGAWAEIKDTIQYAWNRVRS